MQTLVNEWGRDRGNGGETQVPWGKILVGLVVAIGIGIAVVGLLVSKEDDDEDEDEDDA